MGIRVLIADDHVTVRVGLKASLEAAGFDVVDAAKSGDEVMRILTSTTVDLVVTDLAMPSSRFADGAAYISALAATYPDLPVVVLTMVQRPVVLQCVHGFGVAGLIDKAARLDEIVHALRQVLCKKKYVSESLRVLLRATEWNNPAKLVRLSQREQQIIQLLGEGRSMSDIALTLGTSRNTVSTQKRNMMQKLGLRSQIDLFYYIDHVRHRPSRR